MSNEKGVINHGDRFIKLVAELRQTADVIENTPPWVTTGTGLVNELEREIIRLNDESRVWRYNFNMYRSAWLREIGGYIRSKAHEIDGFVLRTRDALKEAEEQGRKEG